MSENWIKVTLNDVKIGKNVILTTLYGSSLNFTTIYLALGDMSTQVS